MSDEWGVRFSEHMGGFFSEGIEDPKTGFSQGKVGGHPIDFWVTIHVSPLKKFFKNVEHPALMEGKVSAGPLGSKLAMRGGEFNMYPGEEGSGLRHISYRFGFDSDAGEPFYFSGVKNIHVNKKQGSSADNVTLYSKLYRGDSEEGEFHGAGVLLFHLLKDGPQLATSLRVTGANSFGEKLRALRLFVSASSA